MSNNLLMRRVIYMLIAAVLFSSVLSGLLYSQQAKTMFADLKADELKVNARRVAEQYYTFAMTGTNTEMFEQLVHYAALSADAEVTVYDGESRVYYVDGKKTLSDEVEVDVNEVQALIRQTHNSIISSATVNEQGVTVYNEVAEIRKLPNSRINYLVVGRAYTGEETGELACVVFFTKPVENVTNSLSGLNKALIIIYLLVFAFILIPIYIASRKMMQPLNAMRDIAMAMADGDFDLRANEEQPGEVGELSRTLNYLAGSLSETISELTLERNRLRHIIDGLAEGIISVDDNLHITQVNPAVCELFDYTPQEGESLVGTDMLPSELVDEFKRVMDERSTVVRTFKWKSMVIRISITPLINDFNRVVGAVALLHDVTESERLEQTRRDFVANVSHELRTPLSALRGLAEVLDDDMLKTEEDKHRYYGYILREALRLNRLVNDLLELSRLQSGSVSTQKVEFDLAETAFEIHEKYMVTADEMEIDFALDMDSEACPRAYGNADRVEQVAVALLDNAFKYTPEKGRITMRVSWDDDTIYIAIQDTGCGIPEEDKGHVFDRFYKVDKAHTGGGTGLGLSIAQEIMTLMGERIWVAGTSAEGTTFIFTVARAKESQ